jgi:hypothetical protein
VAKHYPLRLRIQDPADPRTAGLPDLSSSNIADMTDGLPPFVDDGFAWHVVRRAEGCTIWRRISLNLLSPSAGARLAIKQERHQ